MIEERIAFLKKLLGDWPTFSPKYLDLVNSGVALLEQGMPEPAEHYLQGAIKADTENPIAYELLGFSFIAQKDEGKKARAIEIFGSLTQNKGTYKDLDFSFENLSYSFQSADTYRNLAFALATFGKHHPYVALLRDAMEHEPDDDLLIRIGRIAVTQRIPDLIKRVQDAMEERKLYVKLTPL